MTLNQVVHNNRATANVFDDNRFNIFVPISLKKTAKANGQNTDNDYYVIAGWASTPDRDTQGESVDPIGLDATYFIQNGWINYEHDHSQTIGLPTANSFVDPNHGLYLEAMLFKDNPRVQEIMQLYESLEDLGSTRKLGFSIEGEVKERDEANPGIIKSVWITEVAVTKNPSNLEATWDLLQKSNVMVAGSELNPADKEGFAALTPEALAGKVLSLTYALKYLDMKAMTEMTKKVLKILKDRPSDTTDAQVVTTQLTSGLSRDNSVKLIKLSNMK